MSLLSVYFTHQPFEFFFIICCDSEVSKTDGRVAQTTNLVIGGTVADDSASEWLALDQKVII